eukprot:scaffold5.g915.t1
MQQFSRRKAAGENAQLNAAAPPSLKPLDRAPGSRKLQREDPAAAAAARAAAGRPAAPGRLQLWLPGVTKQQPQGAGGLPDSQSEDEGFARQKRPALHARSTGPAGTAAGGKCTGAFSDSDSEPWDGAAQLEQPVSKARQPGKAAPPPSRSSWDFFASTDGEFGEQSEEGHSSSEEQEEEGEQAGGAARHGASAAPPRALALRLPPVRAGGGAAAPRQQDPKPASKPAPKVTEWSEEEEAEEGEEEGEEESSGLVSDSEAGGASGSDWAPMSEGSSSEEEGQEEQGREGAGKAGQLARKAGGTRAAQRAAPKAAAAGASMGGVAPPAAKRKAASLEPEGKAAVPRPKAQAAADGAAPGRAVEDEGAADGAAAAAHAKERHPKQKRAKPTALPVTIPAALVKQFQSKAGSGGGGPHLLCELPGSGPGGLSLVGDSGVVGRVAVARGGQPGQPERAAQEAGSGGGSDGEGSGGGRRAAWAGAAAPPSGAAHPDAVQLDLNGTIYDTQLVALPVTAALVRVAGAGQAAVMDHAFPLLLRCTPNAESLAAGGSLAAELAAAADDDGGYGSSEGRGGDSEGERGGGGRARDGARGRCRGRGGGGGGKKRAGARKRAAPGAKKQPAPKPRGPKAPSKR